MCAFATLEKVMPPYNLSILDFKLVNDIFHFINLLLIIYPYWILNLSEVPNRANFIPLIIYPYWILNPLLDFKFRLGACLNTMLNLIIYPYWILNIAQASFNGVKKILIIYPYWILNGRNGVCVKSNKRLIIYPYWILNQGKARPRVVKNNL